MHYLINALCLWLALLHISRSSGSLASLTANTKPAESPSISSAAKTDKLDGKKDG
jgi:hypothetical protein